MEGDLAAAGGVPVVAGGHAADAVRPGCGHGEDWNEPPPVVAAVGGGCGIGMLGVGVMRRRSPRRAGVGAASAGKDAAEASSGAGDDLAMGLGDCDADICTSSLAGFLLAGASAGPSAAGFFSSCLTARPAM